MCNFLNAFPKHINCLLGTSNKQTNLSISSNKQINIFDPVYMSLQRLH